MTSHFFSFSTKGDTEENNSVAFIAHFLCANEEGGIRPMRSIEILPLRGKVVFSYSSLEAIKYVDFADGVYEMNEIYRF